MIINRHYGISVLLGETLPPLVILALWDLVVVILFQVYHQEWMEQPALPISLMGSALAIFLGIRNNAAYDRWWEGRTLWGAITNNCRSFGRQAASLLHSRDNLICMMAAYPHILRAALRGIDPGHEIDSLLDEEVKQRVLACTNRPNGLLYEIGLEVRKDVDKNHIDGAVHGTIDRILSDIANAQGGLERIRNTPLPAQYSILPNVVTHIFCIMLPLTAVQTLGWITPLGSSIIGLLFQMLDRAGRDLQEPFSDTVHALPMLSMARNIERDLLCPLGKPLPPVITAENGCLP